MADWTARAGSMPTSARSDRSLHGPGEALTTGATTGSQGASQAWAMRWAEAQRAADAPRNADALKNALGIVDVGVVPALPAAAEVAASFVCRALEVPSRAGAGGAGQGPPSARAGTEGTADVGDPSVVVLGNASPEVVPLAGESPASVANPSWSGVVSSGTAPMNGTGVEPSAVPTSKDGSAAGLDRATRTELESPSSDARTSKTGRGDETRGAAGKVEEALASGGRPGARAHSGDTGGGTRDRDALRRTESSDTPIRMAASSSFAEAVPFATAPAVPMPYESRPDGGGHPPQAGAEPGADDAAPGLRWWVELPSSNHATIRFEDARLGRVAVEVRHEAGAIDLEVLADDAGAAIALRQGEDELRASFRARGTELRSVRVQTRRREPETNQED